VVVAVAVVVAVDVAVDVDGNLDVDVDFDADDADDDGEFRSVSKFSILTARTPLPSRSLTPTRRPSPGAEAFVTIPIFPLCFAAFTNPLTRTFVPGFIMI